MSRIVKIGYIQAKVGKEKENNIKETLKKIELLADKGGQIICLQELFATEYFCREYNLNNFLLADDIENIKYIKDFINITEKYGIVVIVPIFEKLASGIYYNSALVIEDGKIVDIYRKNHIPDDPGFYEKFYFTPSSDGYKVINTKFAKVAVLICWDQWYPEAARIVSLKGAEIIFYPTAIGWDINEKDERINNEQLNAWITIQRAHAIANEVFVVSVNRTGIEGKTIFWGNSFICNPFGTIIYQSPVDKDDTKIIDINLDEIEYYRKIWPFYRDRRIDTYTEITKRFIK